MTGIRRPVAFAALVTLQLLLVLSLVTSPPDDAFGVLVAVALGAPMVLIPLVLFPERVAAIVPLFVVVPGFGLGFAAVEWVLLAAVLAAAVLAGAARRTPRAPHALEGVFALYVAWATITLFQAVDTGEAVAGLIRLVLFCVAFVAGRRLVGPARSVAVVRAGATVAILIAVQLFVVVTVGGFTLANLVENRGLLTDLQWGHSNYIAAVAALSAAVALPLALYGRRRDQVLGFGSVLSAVWVSVATTSRGGTLAIAAGLCLLAVAELRRRFLVVVALVAVVVPTYLLSPLGQASLARFANPGDLFSVGARVVFYRECLGLIRARPLLGVGPDQIPYHTPVHIGTNPHNIFLKNAVDLGLPGLALYLVLLIGVGVVAVRFLRRAADRESRMLALAFVLLLGVGVTNSLYEPALVGAQYGLPFWLIAGALFERAREGRGTAGVPS